MLLSDGPYRASIDQNYHWVAYGYHVENRGFCKSLEDAKHACETTMANYRKLEGAIPDSWCLYLMDADSATYGPRERLARVDPFVCDNNGSCTVDITMDDSIIVDRKITGVKEAIEYAIKCQSIAIEEYKEMMKRIDQRCMR